MKHFNEAEFLKDLQNQHWEYVYVFGDEPNNSWKIWKQMFLEILDKHAPLQQKKIKSKKAPWITRDIRTLLYERDDLKRKAILSKSEHDWSKYKKHRNKANIMLKNAKKEYYSNKIAKQKLKLKEAWNTINSLLGKKVNQFWLMS